MQIGKQPPKLTRNERIAKFASLGDISGGSENRLPNAPALILRKDFQYCYAVCWAPGPQRLAERFGHIRAYVQVCRAGLVF